MYFIVSSRFEMYSSEIYPLFKSTDILNQVKAFVGFHTELSSFEFVLSMNFEINSVFHIRI